MTTSVQAASGPHFRLRWRILLVLGLAQLMVVLDVTIVNIALPSAQAALHFSDASRQWVITAYALAFGSLLLLGGRISDLLGRKWTFIGGLTGFALASAVGGAAPSFAVLIAARAVQGTFAALLAPAALSLLNTIFLIDRERRIAFAVYGAVASAGGAIGLLLGGLLTQYLSWRYCLYVNLVIALPTAGGALAMIRNVPSDSAGRIDVPGALLACCGLFCLVFGLDRAQVDGWTATTTLSFLIAAAVLLVAFVIVELRRGDPLLPIKVVADRNRGGSYLAVLITGLVLFGDFLFLTYYLQETLHMSPSTSGVAFLPMVGVLVIAAATAQTRLLPRFGPRPLIFVGMLLGAAGLVIFAQLDIGSHYASGVLPGLLCSGVGMGLVFSPAMGTATRAVMPKHVGAASALVNTCQQIGGSIGIALLSTVAAHAAASFAGASSAVRGFATANPAAAKQAAELLLARATVHGYTTSFWVAAGVSVGGAIVCGALLRSGPPEALAEPVVDADGAATDVDGPAAVDSTGPSAVRATMG